MFGVEPIVDWEILLHVGQENGDIDNVVPVRAGIFQDQSDVFENSTALLLDVVTSEITRRIERDAGNFFAPAHARSDAGEEKQVADALRVRERANWFRGARAFDKSAHFFGSAIRGAMCEWTDQFRFGCANTLPAYVHQTEVFVFISVATSGRARALPRP